MRRQHRHALAYTKVSALRVALLAALFATAGLSSPPASAAGARQVRDDAGDTVTVKTDACRVVSLAPGTTAMLFAAGAGHCLIGTIAHSDEPTEAAKLPIVGDAETLDFERLLASRPTVVVVAVDVVQRVRIDRIRALGIPVYQVHVTQLDGMPKSLRGLGALLGTSAVADRAAEGLERELAALRQRYADRPPLRVLYQIWDKPIYTIGGEHVINDALRLCGARNLFDDVETAAPAVTREAALARDPELIIASGPADIANAWIEEWRRFPTLTAVRRGKLVTHTDARIDRMGPSVIAATANLCAVIDAARPAKDSP